MESKVGEQFGVDSMLKGLEDRLGAESVSKKYPLKFGSSHEIQVQESVWVA